ncbi:transmembrane protein, putative (macronuclear) [Tetrahymena thermophila SB210]|uniref:Transmembrane protein, putative n=1 Tax=Tetrahymena thermophila (strain SB210) TaxID=312017 RepID=W7X3V1_TETTS|nr:transmembrane protein, putative [Tetrahymena thermophila SB210]EWS73995.1 transmembrane protein, putative [Tetrahymena thermophila SB210]|eukprot:XP_012653457.1 transmembrane protein, putative [Tetrahymena thermophila SB210]
MFLLKHQEILQILSLFLLYYSLLRVLSIVLQEILILQLHLHYLFCIENLQPLIQAQLIKELKFIKNGGSLENGTYTILETILLLYFHQFEILLRLQDNIQYYLKPLLFSNHSNKSSLFLFKVKDFLSSHFFQQVKLSFQNLHYFQSLKVQVQNVLLFAIQILDTQILMFIYFLQLMKSIIHS